MEQLDAGCETLPRTGTTERTGMRVVRAVEAAARLRAAAALSRARRRLVGPHGYAILCDSDQGTFAVDPADVVVGRRLLRDGIWAGGELTALAEYLVPDARVLIVGAHIGSLAVPIGRRVKSVLAVEANPHTLDEDRGDDGIVFSKAGENA